MLVSELEMMYCTSSSNHKVVTVYKWHNANNKQNAVNLI